MAMDSTSRRPQLPALSYLNVDKVKQEEESYSGRPAVATPTSNGSFSTSPSHHYPPGPPPPYTHSAPPQHANTWPGANPPVHTPPESRRASGEDHENGQQTGRQVLPSISEAIGPLESQQPYAPHAPAPETPSQHSQPPSTLQTSAPRSPPRRSYPMEPPPPPPQNPHSYSFYRQDSAGPPPFPTTDSSKPAYGPGQDSHPSHSAQSSFPPPRSQPPTGYAYSQNTSSQVEQQRSAPPTSMPPPPAPGFTYGYTSYPPRFAQPTPTSNSGPIYQPSAQHAPPASQTWKSEPAPARYIDDRSSVQPHGESVKRHLDMYDLEASLNEIGQTSHFVQDFARRYSERMHQLSRTTPSMSQLPTLVEIEDMIQRSRVQLDSLTKIRDVVQAQKSAHEQEMAEQRHKAFAEPALPHLEPHGEVEDSKIGFAGADAKKRRGRAAPPGRCHSCNRAETPEWRRGPDGARTLCNACGLHYAKLTRKQTTKQTANPGSSNLRPKEG